MTERTTYRVPVLDEESPAQAGGAGFARGERAVGEMGAHSYGAAVAEVSATQKKPPKPSSAGQIQMKQWAVLPIRDPPFALVSIVNFGHIGRGRRRHSGEYSFK